MGVQIVFEWNIAFLNINILNKLTYFWKELLVLVNSSGVLTLPENLKQNLDLNVSKFAAIF